MRFQDERQIIIHDLGKEDGEMEKEIEKDFGTLEKKMDYNVP